MTGGSRLGAARLSRRLAAAGLLAVSVLLSQAAGTLAQEAADANADAGGAAAGPLPEEPAEPLAELSPAERNAQEQIADPFPGWDRLAERAESSLDAGLASTAAFEHLRADLVTWRSRFQAAQVANQGRIAALKAQIAALGPPPEAGQTEEAELASRREELRRQLSRLEAPQRAAEEAYSRADGLIRQIDSLIRERQTGELLRLGPSPLNLTYWPAALADLTGTLRLIAGELIEVATDRGRLAEAKKQLPLILGLLVLALLLLLRSRRWLRDIERRLTQNRSGQTAGVMGFIGSILRMALFFGGFVALHLALELSGLLGFRGQVIGSQIVNLGLFTAVSHWLAIRIFARSEAGSETMWLVPERRAEGQVFVHLLGLMMWLIVVIRTLSEFESYPEASRAVLQFPVLVVAGVCLARIGHLIGRPRSAQAAEAPGRDFRRSLARNVGKAVVVLGVLGPILAAIGYQAAASFLTFPAAFSLALIAALTLAHTALSQAYGLATGRSETQVREALMPVLIGMLLALASAPVFALIWGARIADLTEIWARFRDGFSLGDVRISPGQLLTFLLVFAIGYGLTRLVQGTLKSAVLPKTRIDTGGQNAIVSGLGYLGIFLAGLLAITSTGVSLSSLAFVAGALSLGIGFGLQNIVQNFVAGIIMLIERPVAEGDWIEVGGNQGIVKAISVRSTRIETFDKNSVIVPNANFISGVVTNWTRGNLSGRIVVNVGVAYGSDTRKVEKILREIVEAHPLVTLTPPPSVSFENFGADSLDFVVRAILRDINFGLATRSELRHEIARRFAEEGIEIPFGQRDIWLRNPEKLADALVRPAPPPERRSGKAAVHRPAAPGEGAMVADAATNPAEGAAGGEAEDDD